MGTEKKQTNEKQITVSFSTTNEMTAKSALKMLLDTYNSTEEDAYQEAQ